MPIRSRAVRCRRSPPTCRTTPSGVGRVLLCREGQGTACSAADVGWQGLGHTAINRVRRHKLPAAEHQGDPGEADGRVLLRQAFVRQVAA